VRRRDVEGAAEGVNLREDDQIIIKWQSSVSCKYGCRNWQVWSAVDT
jgi:hypothetical protein